MQEYDLVKNLIYGKVASKLLQIMKMMTVIILVGCLQVSAGGYSQGITLDETNAPLGRVLDKIDKQTEYNFWYSNAIIAKVNKVSIHVKNERLEIVLKKLFEGLPLTYEFVEKMVVVKERGVNKISFTFGAFNDPVNVKGKVVNDAGEPLEGVTVTVRGSKISTNTDVKGEFSLTGIDKKAVLVFSHISMRMIETRFIEGSSLVVTMTSLYDDMNNVVSTGYIKIPKEKSVGSYTVLDSANFHRRAGMTIIDRLDGTVPSMLLDKKSAGAFAIQIRGISTLRINTSSDPLIIVDEFPMDNAFRMENLNPNDVESVTILKDAATISQWGARAANGVIVITTKRGRYNQKPSITFSSNIGISDRPDLFYFPRISTTDFIEIEKFLFEKGFYNGNISNTFTYPVISPVVEILDKKRRGLISNEEANSQINALRKYDVRNELNNHYYRPSTRQQHYLSVGGGSRNYSYQFSLGYNNNTNNTRGSKADQQVTMNAVINIRPAKKIDIQAGVNVASGIARSFEEQLPALFPYSRIIGDDGNPMAVLRNFRASYLDTVGAGALLDWNYRPLDEVRLADIKNQSRALKINVAGTYSLFKWLRATIRYQYSNSLNLNRNHKSIETYETRDLINRFTNLSESNLILRYPVPKGGILDLSATQFQSYNLRGTLNFNKDWAALHSMSGVIAAEIYNAKGGLNNSQRLYGYDDFIGSYNANMDYLHPYPMFFGVYPNARGLIPANNAYSEQDINRFVSIMTSVGYTFKNRYNLYLSGRRDGANVFGVNTNNKWKPLWSSGISWNVSREPFFDISWVSSLKLRASYGYSGNTSGLLSGKFIINHSTAPDIYTGLPVSFAGRAPNPDLKWEEVRIVNLGVDFQLLNERITGSLELFNKKSDDVISGLPYPQSSGVNIFIANAASLKAHGWEFVVNATNIDKRLSWTTNLAISYVKTVVTDVFRLFGGYRVEDFLSYGLNQTKGQIAFGMSSLRWAGLDPATGDPQGWLKGHISKDYLNIFADSVQNQIFHGSSVPLYSGFFRNTFTWKGFSFSFNITGRFKYYFRQPALELSYWPTPTSTNYSADYYRRWQKPGDEASTDVPSMPYPVPAAVSQRNSFYRFAEIHVKKADNLRLQDIRFSYRISGSKIRNNLIKNIELFFYANNLNVIIWRAEKSRFDPDFTGGTGDPITGPTPRIWTGGITVNF